METTVTMRENFDSIIGLTALDDSSPFTWASTGLPVDFAVWRPHEPNNYDKSDYCVIARATQGEWVVNSCTKHLRGITCENVTWPWKEDDRLARNLGHRPVADDAAHYCLRCAGYHDAKSDPARRGRASHDLNQDHDRRVRCQHSRGYTRTA
jgi:hypothetical protein